MKGYFASPLFSQAEQIFNEYLVKNIREKFTDLEIHLPQESDINDKNSYADSIMIAEQDAKELLDSDFMIAVLDGNEIDSGVATEIGIFYTTGKPIIGLYTDARQSGRDNPKKVQALVEDALENQFTYRNLFVVGTIKSTGEIVDNEKDLLNAIKRVINKEIK